MRKDDILMRIVAIGTLCLIVALGIVIAVKAVNEATVFMDDSFRWGNGRDY